MTINYSAEGRVREVAAENGVLPHALEDVVSRFRAGQFTEAELPARIKEWRDTPNHHFFNVGGAEDNRLFIEAFGDTPSLTAQGAVVRKYGETRAAEIAAQFGASVGVMKPGKVPDTIKSGTNASNPFAKLRGADGKIDPTAAAKVDGLIKSLGTKKAEAIARAVGKTITGLPLQA